MKTNLTYCLILLPLVFVVSCIDFSNNIKKKETLAEDDFVSIATNDEYEVRLPKYMKEASDLNAEASLQYQNIFKETYFVVIDEPKQDFIEIFTDMGEYDESSSVAENYRDIQLRYFQESLTEYDFEGDKKLTINGLDAEAAYFDGKIEGVIHPIAYNFSFIEGDEKVYMLMAWTLKDRKEKYRDTFDKIIKSFKLID